MKSIAERRREATIGEAGYLTGKRAAEGVGPYEEQRTAGEALSGAAQAGEVMKKPVDRERLTEWLRTLQKYKAGKASIERRVISAENWWRLRNRHEAEKATRPGLDDFYCVSGWLHNVIVSKHADAMEAYPEPNFLPREPGDRAEATMLSSIVPVILEQNRFERTYDATVWQKLKTGTGVYMVTWDAQKLGGLGDISIERVDLLNLFWEPGIDDIQDSKMLFYTYLEDKEQLEGLYPEIKGKLKNDVFTATKFLYDDHVDTENKATVINAYYHTYQGSRRVLQYCKFVGDHVLFSTENEDPEKGLYDHGRYPFVIDTLFPVEGSPAGYGFIDLASNTQMQIDVMKTAFLKNTMVGATPRYFNRGDGGINEEEFLDLSKPIVHVTGSLADDWLKPIDYKTLSGNYISVLQNTVNELRETTGNTETATGSTSAGVTAASAIAALQEASGKGSRDSSRASYRAFSDLCDMAIELIRQFYDMPRRFRITGKDGEMVFVSYGNAGLKPQLQMSAGGQELYRLPVFDIKIEPQKKTAYTRMTQNELTLQLYGLGFFDPANADIAATTLDMMEFDGKEELLQKIQSNGTMQQKLIQYQKMALALAQKYQPELVPGLAQDITGQPAAQVMPQGRKQGVELAGETTEASHVKRAREQSQQASQPM